MTTVHDYIDACEESIEKIRESIHSSLGTFIFEVRLRIDELELHDDILKDMYITMSYRDEYLRDCCIACLKKIKELYRSALSYDIDMSDRVPPSLIHEVDNTYNSKEFTTILTI
jgi:hypothetical protein